MEMESKLSHRATSVQKLDQKELRKRSLNFHHFLTVKQSDVEVARSTLALCKTSGHVTSMLLRQLLLELESSSGFYNFSSVMYERLLKRIRSHFNEIPGTVYPKILRIVGESKVESRDATYLVERILGRIVVSEPIRKMVSEGGVVAWVAVLAAASKVASTPARKTAQLAILDLCRNGVERDPVALREIAMCLSTFHTIFPWDRAVLRMLHRATAMILSAACTEPQGPAPVLTLFGSGVPPPITDHPQLLRLVEEVLAIKHTPPSKELSSMLKVYFELHASRHSLRELVPVVRDAHSILKRSFQETRNLNSLSLCELKSIHSGLSRSNFEDRFSIIRLENALRLKCGSSGFRPLDSSHDKLGIKILGISKLPSTRFVRKQLHALIAQIKPGRLTVSVLRKFGERTIKCHWKDCAVCNKFGEGVTLALAFHYPS